MFLLLFTNVELSFSRCCSWLKGEAPGTRTLAAGSQKKRFCSVVHNAESKTRQGLRTTSYEALSRRHMKRLRNWKLEVRLPCTNCSNEGSDLQVLQLSPASLISTLDQLSWTSRRADLMCQLPRHELRRSIGHLIHIMFRSREREAWLLVQREVTLFKYHRALLCSSLWNHARSWPTDSHVQSIDVRSRLLLESLHTASFVRKPRDVSVVKLVRFDHSVGPCVEYVCKPALFHS